MSKKTLTKLQVLQYVKEGKTVKEIANISGSKENAIYRHIHRLKEQNYLPRDGRKQSGNGHRTESETVEMNLEQAPMPVTNRPLTDAEVERLADAMFAKVGKTLDLEKALEEAKERINKLQNVLAAKENELAIANDDIRKKDELLRDKAERAKKVSELGQRLAMSEIATSIEAQN